MLASYRYDLALLDTYWGRSEGHNSSVLSVDPLHLNFGRGKRVKKNSVNNSKVPLLTQPLSGLEKLVHY